MVCDHGAGGKLRETDGLLKSCLQELSGRSPRAAVQKNVRRTLVVVVIAAATLTAAGTAGAQPTTRWLIIVDDLHLDFRNTGHLRTLLKTIVSGLIHDGDAFALDCTGPSSVSVAWTDDRSVIDRVSKEIAGNALKVSDMLAIMRGLTPTNEVEFRATLAVSRVNEIVAILDPAAVIYISNGYVEWSPSFADALGRARMPVFALDPRLLPGAIVDRAGVDAASWNAYWAATRNSLRALSEQSGGFALEEGQDLAATLARINELVRR